MMDSSLHPPEEEIFENLRSYDTATQLRAVAEAHRLQRVGPDLLDALETVALKGSARARQAALDALDSVASQRARASHLKHLRRSERDAILAELEDWESRGLISPEGVQVLKRRYDWDRRPVPPPESAAAPAPVPRPARASGPRRPSPVTAAAVQEAAPAAARASLSDRLLSQTASNIALYLGAFLVIGAAIILAALVEVTRVPILLSFTALFGLGATAMRRRLPQPSYVLFMVFSVLLPISANAVAQTLHLRGQGLHLYWSALFLLMAAIWAFGTRLYASRLFSLAALVAWSLAFHRLPMLADPDLDWQYASLMMGLAVALSWVPVLRRWRFEKIASSFFVGAQIAAILALLMSALLTFMWIFEGSEPHAWGALILLSMSAGAFYVVSGQLSSFALFPWLAVGCLAPLTVPVFGVLDASGTAQAIGMAAWGLFFMAISEVAARSPIEQIRRYHWPSLAIAPVLMVLGAAVAVLQVGTVDEPVAYTFGILLAAALGGTTLHILRPRAYVWLITLIFGLGAYFTFFALPFLRSAHVYWGYVMLGAASLLLAPELAFREPFKGKDAWRWPSFLLGSVLAAIAWLIFILSGPERVSDAAFGMGVLTLLLAGHAVHLRKPWIGYLAAGASAIALNLASNGSSLDRRLILLTALSGALYVAGVLLRAEPRRAWGTMLRASALALGSIVVPHYFLHPALWSTLSINAGGYCTLVIGLMFLAETYFRRAKHGEALAPLVFSLASFLILRQFGNRETAWHLYSVSLIWLSADLLYARTLPMRPLKWMTRIIGVLLTLAAATALILRLDKPWQADQVAWALAAYALIFGLSAWLYHQPRISSAASAAAALAILFALRYARLDSWLPALTAFAVIHYAAGFLLRKRGISGWGTTIRASGLALGAIVAAAGVLLEKPQTELYALISAALFVVETYQSGGSRAEVGGPALLSLAVFAAARALAIDDLEYVGLATSMAWLGADVIYHRTLQRRPWMRVTQVVGVLFAVLLSAWLVVSGGQVAATCFTVLAVFLAAFAWFYQEPVFGYPAAAALAAGLFFEAGVLEWDNHLLAISLLATSYYAGGYLLRSRGSLPEWAEMLIRSGLALGALNALSAASHISMPAAIPVAIAATLFATEAFARRMVWLALPANALYLWAYILILLDLKVEQPQFYSVGAALLGLLMHYLLNRNRYRKSAFYAGMLSQLVLLGTTFYQLVVNAELMYFVVIFFQGLAVLAYGVVIRSRSLLITPILFVVASVLLVIYSTLKGLTTVVLIGCSGVILLALGIMAVVLRERIARLGDRMGDWQA